MDEDVPGSPAPAPPDSPGAATPWLLAGDVGGTSSRLVLAAPDGTVRAEVTGPGANLRSSGTDALDHVRDAARTLLARGEALCSARAPVAAAVLGVSGAGPARAAEVRAAVTERLGALGIDPARVRVTDDLLTAFLSGGVGDDGLLLLAGTGAVGVRFEGREAVARRDGMGWLLGDVGSAVWLGRRTLEAVAADLDGRGPRTGLTEALGAVLELDLRDGARPPSTTGDPRQDLIRALDDLLPAGAPAALGRFAPLPGTLPEDEVAGAILAAVVAHVRDGVRALDPRATLPVVLAGSVHTAPGPLRTGIEAALREEGRLVRSAVTGLPGALLLASELAARRAAEPDGRDH
ncbi:N-acetylglucosamine kinase [Brachybacterium saurashtrense]|uniref:N-acetylglucosamine kinase n=1 Tax=Brachybacterium saurashtrense TaxID=556288 RepID=A0A345YPY4_9MICO|nr:BadF/BadG/BcrA/BcrD ATPase family protein [Brachybacterium saurashtrense]AXK45986.1 N-acetylglucosamine kinase [Brachybacterium saurashtrense]RRR23725.1 N-acetylglucosamine kinase [Brachybacterium saurashtrense]